MSREACVGIKIDNNDNDNDAGLQDLRCGEMMPVMCTTVCINEDLANMYKVIKKEKSQSLN
jgi:hypothetical protein